LPANLRRFPAKTNPQRLENPPLSGLAEALKKSLTAFERSADFSRPMFVGAVIPPQRLYLARAPIHPKRPYGLTRPVVPPDGSFVLGAEQRSLPAAQWPRFDRQTFFLYVFFTFSTKYKIICHH
jgi:hypothetical protein